MSLSFWLVSLYYCIFSFFLQSLVLFCVDLLLVTHIIWQFYSLCIVLCIVVFSGQRLTSRTEKQPTGDEDDDENDESLSKGRKMKRPNV